MAKVIATAGGVLLRPGVSANRRWYTPEIIADAVKGAQQRLAAGETIDVVRSPDDGPLTQLTHHAAEDDSSRIVGRLTSVSLDENGNARYTAAFADTPHARAIASLVDTSDGNPPFLKGVSIRGHWKGDVRQVKGPAGETVTQGDALVLDGLDYTRSPGVKGAGVDTFAWAGGKPSESAGVTYITESAPEAIVTFTEEAAAEAAEQSCSDMGHQCCKDAGDGESAPAGDVSEADDAKTDAPAGTTYADPGYLKDGKKRYPLNSPKRIRAAWSYINQTANAAQYSASQLKRIKGKIKAAMGRIGATVTSEGWAIWPPEQVAETDAAVAEYMGDGPGSGSFSVCASNGPLNITMSSWCVDPADLDLVLRAVAAAAADALKAIDPDMDGDMDIPGADGMDTDGDAQDSAPDEPDPANETSPADEAGDEAAPAADSQEEAVTDATNTETAATAPAPVTLTQEQFGALLARVAPQPAATEPAPVATEAVQSAAQAQPAAPAAVAETREQRDARLTALVEAAVSKRAVEEGLVTEETDEAVIARLVEAQLTPLRQAAAERDGTGTARKGLLESIGDGAPGTVKMLQEASNEDLARVAASAYPPPPSLRRQ